MKEFTVVLRPDEKKKEFFNVRIPALLGAFTYGPGESNAIAQTKLSIERYCLSLKENRKNIPAAVAEINLSDYESGSFIRKVQVDI